MKVILTGPPGIGKTSVVRSAVRMLGDRAVGFWTEEVRDRRSGKRTGFRVVTTWGDSALFASKTFTSKKLVGSYGVNVEIFEKVAVQPLWDELERIGDRIAVIDEIGKMELFSKSFRELVKAVVHDHSISLLATVPIRDVHPVVREVRRLKGAVLIEVSRENRDSLPSDILNLLKN